MSTGSVGLAQVSVSLGLAGGYAVPQGDVNELTVHLGATTEVSSFDLKLQNYGGKYSPGGTHPILLGVTGGIGLCRAPNNPASLPLISLRVESIKHESDPENYYVLISGRCWGEMLFRRTITKDYSGYKGEAIVKDIINTYTSLSHVRGGLELIANTSTTFNSLKVTDSPAWDLLQQVAAASDNNGVIAYDFRVAPDGNFEFFPRGSKTSGYSSIGAYPNTVIESYEYWKEITAVRNKITIYGVADKSIPLNKTDWVQSLTPTSGVWTAPVGSVSIETAMGSPYCIKGFGQNNDFAELDFTLTTPVNGNLYSTLNFALEKENYWSANTQITLYDTSGRTATRMISVTSPGNGAQGKFTTQTFNVGTDNAADWNANEAFDWTQIKKVVFYMTPTTALGLGYFWIDRFYFGGLRYSDVEQDNTSIASYGQREYVDTNEELYSDAECALNAKATLAFMKDPFEYVTLKSTVIDYGTTPFLPADMIYVSLPNENVSENFRILNVEYHLRADTQELEITMNLGHEKPLLADYLYVIRRKLGAVNRYKASKL